MKCTKCGTEMDNNALICPFCGQAVSDEERILAQHSGEKLTKKEFLNLPAMKTCKSNINTCGILLYILGAINIALAVVSGLLPIDGILLILFGLGIHLGKSRVCAILCTAFTGLSMVYTIAQTGTRSGWWILIIAIDAIVYTFKYHSAWSKYQKDGTLPADKK